MLLDMMHLLINDVILSVKIGNNTDPKIHKNIGTGQDYCLSALMFILYLSNTVKPLPSQIEAIRLHLTG